MRRTYERGTKANLSFSGGPHAPVNMADSMEEVNVRGERHVFCIVVRSTLYFVCYIFRKISKFFGISIASLSNYWHSPYIRHVYRRVWPVREASLALVPRSYVLRMIMKLAY